MQFSTIKPFAIGEWINYISMDTIYMLLVYVLGENELIID